MNAHIDATVLIALGQIDGLERLSVLTPTPVVLPSVRSEVTSEPARTAVARAVEADVLTLATEPPSEPIDRAAAILADPEDSADTRFIAAVLADLEDGEAVAVVSDDRRLRTVAGGLGATVTGSIGVVVRAVDRGLDPEDGEASVRDLDQHGLHMTAELRERAYELIDASDE